ncbi:MAG: hypothetical protein K2G91_01565, partial [Prevotella sp.]|nr:hypothetical protein [Prevotella sp.]
VTASHTYNTIKRFLFMAAKLQHSIEKDKHRGIFLQQIGKLPIEFRVFLFVVFRKRRTFAL